MKKWIERISLAGLGLGVILGASNILTVMPACAQEDAMGQLESSASNACLLPPPPPVTQGNPVFIISWSSAGWTVDLEDRARHWQGEQYAEYEYELYNASDVLFQQYKAATHSPVQ